MSRGVPRDRVRELAYVQRRIREAEARLDALRALSLDIAEAFPRTSGSRRHPEHQTPNTPTTMTLSTVPLHESTLQLLADFASTRFDALCGHLGELHGHHPKAHTVITEAQDIVAELQRAARWAAVPAGLVRHHMDTVRAARRMWAVDGKDLNTVSLFCRQSVGTAHLELVLSEAYRSGVTDGPERGLVEPVLDEAGFDVAYVATPPEAAGDGLPAEDVDTDADVARERRSSQVASIPQVPGHRPVA